MKFTDKTTLGEIITMGGEDILHANRVPCMACPLAAQEINSLSIGQVARIYQLDSGKIIKELNIKLKEKKS